MSDDLYQTHLMRLAGDAAAAGRLESPDASVTLDNPLCGDRITIDVRIDQDGRITDVAQETRACVLCQASASVIGAHAEGRTAEEINEIAKRLQDLLKNGTALPADPQWRDLSAFEPVSAHKSRHNCVLLPFNAVAQALKEAAASK
jgi:nitrogen fixation NifU-like protein